MTAILIRSPEASELHAEASRYVDLVGRKHYDGRIPHNVAGDIYRNAVGSFAHRRMLDELGPINRGFYRIAAMSLEPLTTPPALEEMRSRTIKRWGSVVAELLG